MPSTILLPSKAFAKTRRAVRAAVIEERLVVHQMGLWLLDELRNQRPLRERVWAGMRSQDTIDDGIGLLRDHMETRIGMALRSRSTLPDAIAFRALCEKMDERLVEQTLDNLVKFDRDANRNTLVKPSRKNLRVPVASTWFPISADAGLLFDPKAHTVTIKGGGDALDQMLASSPMNALVTVLQSLEWPKGHGGVIRTQDGTIIHHFGTLGEQSVEIEQGCNPRTRQRAFVGF